MSNLTPEVRVNKNGVSVTKHVRTAPKQKTSGFLSRLLPASLNPSAKKHREELFSSLRKELSDASNVAIAEWRELIAAETDPDKRELMVQSPIFDIEDLEYARNQLERHSTETLELLHETFHGSGNLREFLRKAPNKEADLRANIVFRNCTAGFPISSQILDDVRRSMGIKDLSAIEEGSAEYDRVDTVLRFAKGVASRRLAARVKVYDESEDWDSDSKIERVSLMSSALAAVALDYPDRAEDILDYIEDKKLTPADVDGEHLRLYLDTPSTALSSGIL